MTDQEKLLEKLRKMRAHQKSAEAIGSEEEAQAFAAKLYELLNRHKLNMSDIEWEEHQKEVPIERVYVSHRQAGLKTSRIRVAWMMELAGQIGIAFNCAVLLTRSNRDFFYVGEKIEAEQARDTYGYMVKVAESLSDKEYVKYFYECKAAGDVTAARGFRQGFLFGFVTRLQQRFEEERKKLDVGYTGTALMRISNSLTRARKSLEDDKDLISVKTHKMNLPENLEGVLRGRKQAEKIKFGAERLKP